MPTMRGCGSEHRLRKPPRAESELMERQSEREHQSQREHQSERERERELCVRENCVRRRRTERSRGRGGRDPWPLAEEHGAGHVGERALEQRHDARVHGRVGVALRLQARHRYATGERDVLVQVFARGGRRVHPNVRVQVGFSGTTVHQTVKASSTCLARDLP